jgi:hypothetical protein
MKPLLVSRAILKATLEALNPAGREGRESVALWLVEPRSDTARVAGVHVPAQYSTGDMFQIPRESVVALLELVGRTGLVVAAQVHTHPAEAFHSFADDNWAIVRHHGAISIVLPGFALDTEVSTFWTDAAVFQLSAANEWSPVPHRLRAAVLREEP